ncbi:MAG: universal stress protein, partial [Chloroflexi bacterium]|nr:universal stress protein [Chloroflexota bacterium]
MFGHFLVPLDGSKLAEAVLPDACALAQRLRARMTLLHIVEQHAPTTVHGDTHLRQPPEAERYLHQLAQQWSRNGVQVESHVHSEQPQNVAKMIVDQAAELSADLIVLSTHGHSDLREKLLGSIAQQVVHEGRVPVLLVRPQREPTATLRAVNNILLPLDGERVHERAIPVAMELADALGATVHLLSVVPTLETLSGQESTPG